MADLLNVFIMNRIRHFVKNTAASVAEINRKYATPQIKASVAAKLSLLCLRIYLLLLLGILFYKFYMTLAKRS